MLKNRQNAGVLFLFSGSLFEKKNECKKLFLSWHWWDEIHSYCSQIQHTRVSASKELDTNREHEVEKPTWGDALIPEYLDNPSQVLPAHLWKDRHILISQRFNKITVLKGIKYAYLFDSSSLNCKEEVITRTWFQVLQIHFIITSSSQCFLRGVLLALCAR